MISGYERGIVTPHEAAYALIDVMVGCDTDDEALAHCEGLPDWFNQQLRESLDKWAASDYYVRQFRIGDTRTADQVEADSRRIQARLRTLAPKILAVL